MKRNQILVLAISESQWGWAVYQNGGRAPEKTAGGILELSDSSVTDMTPAEAAADTLLSQWRRQGLNFEGLRTTMGIASEDVLLRVMSLPSVEPQELSEMCALQIEKTSPFGADQTVSAYESLESSQNDTVVLAVGADIKRINAMGDVFRNMGLKPERVDLNICALWEALTDRSAVSTPPPAERILHLIPHKASCDGIITQNGRPVLFRSLGRRSGLDDQAYAEELASQATYSLAACDLEHEPISSPSVIIRSSGAPCPDGLEDALKDAGIRKLKVEESESPPDLCARLAIRALAVSSPGLNLAPPEWRLAEFNRIRRRRLLLTFGGAAALWLAAVGGIRASLIFERRRLNTIEQNRLELEHPYEQAISTRARVGNLMQHKDQSGSALETLREISANQPAGIDLSSFDYRKGLMIRLGGEAGNAASIYEFKNRLDASPLFAGTDPPSIARSSRGERETFRMTINLNREHPAASTP